MSHALSASFRTLVLPKEHGSWSFAFEPVALGLLVAPSRAGFVLAAAVAAGFFVRRPLKLATTLPATDARRGPARQWALVWSALAFTGIISVSLLASWTALWPLLLCVPFAAIFLWFDLHNDMREAEAELSGSAVFALLPATMATLAGWSAAISLGLAAVMLARSLPTILTVRTYLRRAKGQPVHLANAIATASAATLAITLLVRQHIVPTTAALLVAALLLRTIIFLLSLRPNLPAKRIGIFEAALGCVYLSGLTLAYHLR